MKFATALASLAAMVPATMAVDPRFPDSGPFKMIVLAYETPIHYSYVQATDGYLTIGTTTNSSCGDIDAPTFNGGNGAVSTYANDSTMGQQVFVDISGAAGGLVSYIGPLWTSIPTSSVHDKFSRVAGDTISELYNENKTWIACPVNTNSTASYFVYSAADYSRQTKEGCIDFEIRTDKADNPQSCTYY